MKILITGGFGFIGARIAKHLIEKGYNVILGTRDSFKSRTPDILEAEVLETKWDDISTLKRVCTGLDVIVHTAGLNAEECLRNPIEALRVNGLATATILSAAIEKKVQKFIYFSTSHVYSDVHLGRFDETSCLRNLHPYATSHRIGENEVVRSRRNNLIDGYVLRLSNGFGVPVFQDSNCWKLVVNQLCRQVAYEGKIVLNSSGVQKRNFIPMTEICNASEFFVRKKSKVWNDENDDNLFNLGSNTSMTILELAKLIQERSEVVLGFRPELLLKKQGIGEKAVEFEFQIDRLRRIGYEPCTNTSDEIDKLLLYCKDTK